MPYPQAIEVPTLHLPCPPRHFHLPLALPIILTSTLPSPSSHYSCVQLPLYPALAAHARDTTCTTSAVGVALNGVRIRGPASGAPPVCGPPGVRLFFNLPFITTLTEIFSPQIGISVQSRTLCAQTGAIRHHQPNQPSQPPFHPSTLSLILTCLSSPKWGERTMACSIVAMSLTSQLRSPLWPPPWMCAADTLAPMALTSMRCAS